MEMLRRHAEAQEVSSCSMLLFFGCFHSTNILECKIVQQILKRHRDTIDDSQRSKIHDGNLIALMPELLRDFYQEIS